MLARKALFRLYSFPWWSRFFAAHLYFGDLPGFPSSSQMLNDEAPREHQQGGGTSLRGQESSLTQLSEAEAETLLFKEK